jgi:hypothetical protein
MNEMKSGWEKGSARRLAYAVAIIMVLLIPVHGYVSCKMSGNIFGLSFGLLVLNGLFSYVDRTGKGIHPFAMGLVVFIVHTLSTH